MASTSIWARARTHTHTFMFAFDISYFAAYRVEYILAHYIRNIFFENMLHLFTIFNETSPFAPVHRHIAYRNALPNMAYTILVAKQSVLSSLLYTDTNNMLLQWGAFTILIDTRHIFLLQKVFSPSRIVPSLVYKIISYETYIYNIIYWFFTIPFLIMSMFIYYQDCLIYLKKCFQR